MLLTAWRHDFVRTLVGVVGKVNSKDLGSGYDELVTAARKQLAADSLDAARANFSFAADLRYRGQEHAITVPVAGPDAFARNEDAVRARFHELHELRYGHAAAEETIEIVNVRLTVTVARDDPELRGYLQAPWRPEDSRPEQKRDVVFDNPEQPLAARILWRPGLPPGLRFEGPAVIEEPNSTTLVFPGNMAEITPHGHIVITL
jgi:N-methylhydantoinase A